MNLSSGRIWPYTISFLIILVFGFCVATVIVTSNADIQESDFNMDTYQEVNININEIIENKISFNQKYKVEFSSDSLSVDDTTLKFIVQDLNLKPIDNAKFNVILNRSMGDIKINLEKPTVDNGIYRFKSVKLTHEGVWNILVRVDIADNYRYYNLKVDTRTQEIFDKFKVLKVGDRVKKLLHN
ncbi:MAG: hypothetical protein U9N02_00205 [Campylobacterota bacterium]|nr:hypothetical protein [Campylobacterota bacterium]